MSSTLKCSSCNIVICELLAFIQNKQDVMDEKSLVTLCITSFSKEDIDAAKNLLFSAVSQRKIRRKNAKKSFKDLHDVIAVFKESNPEDLPTFVAKELQKLPPLTFDHIDASRLLKDVILLKNDLQLIKDSYATLEQLQEIKAELLHAKQASIIATPNHFVNIKRGGGCQNSICFDSGPFGLPHIPVSTQRDNAPADCIDNQHSPAHSHSGETAVRSPSQPQPPESMIDMGTVDKLLVQKSVCTDNKVHYSTPASKTKSKTLAEIVNEGQQLKSTEPSSEDWIRIQRKRHRNRFVTVEGKAYMSPQEKFKAADIKIPLFINNVDKNTKEADIMEYISSKTQVNVNLRKVNSKEQKQYNAYIVYVPKNKLSVFMNDSLWPEGVYFRRFVDFKRNLRQTDVNLDNNKNTYKKSI